MSDNLSLNDVAAGLAEVHMNQSPPLSQYGYEGTIGNELDKGMNTREGVSLKGDGFVRVHFSEQGGGSPGVTAGRAFKDHKSYTEEEYLIPIGSKWNVFRIDRRSRNLGKRINGVPLSTDSVGDYMRMYEREWSWSCNVKAPGDGTNRFAWCDPTVTNATGTNGVITFNNVASVFHFNKGDIVCVIAGGATKAAAQTGHLPGTTSARRATVPAEDEGGLRVIGRSVRNRTITVESLDGTPITDLNIAVPTFAEGDHIGFLGAYRTDDELSQGIPVTTDIIGHGGYFFQFTQQAQLTQYGVNGSTNPDLFGLREQISSSITPEQLASLLRRVVPSLPRMDDLGIDDMNWDATLYYPLNFDTRVGAAFEGRSRVDRSTAAETQAAQFRTGFSGWVTDVGNHRIRLKPCPQMSDPWSRYDEDVVMRLIPDRLVAMPSESANGGPGKPAWEMTDGAVFRYERGSSEVQVARFGADCQIVPARLSAGVTFSTEPDLAIP